MCANVSSSSPLARFRHTATVTTCVIQRVALGSLLALSQAVLRIAIIIGSTRTGRNAEAVAKWAYDIGLRGFHGIQAATAPADQPHRYARSVVAWSGALNTLRDKRGK